MEKNELMMIVESSGLEPTKAQTLLKQFQEFFVQAGEWEQKAKMIVITDPSQKEEMKQAREARLALKNIRTTTESTRKALKENSIREGKLIDSLANIVKGLIEPIEVYLEGQEKFIEKREAEQKAQLLEERTEKLKPYVEDVSFYNIKEMTDEGFEKLLESAKQAFYARVEAEKKVEEERKKNEEILKKQQEEERIEQERIREENEKLKKEAEQKALQDKIEKEKQQKIIDDANKAKLEAEKKLKEKEEAEKKAKKEAEEKLKKEAEQKIEQERLARLAPDQEKLNKLADEFMKIIPPTVTTEEARKKLSDATILLDKIILILRSK